MMDRGEYLLRYGLAYLSAKGYRPDVEQLEYADRLYQMVQERVKTPYAPPEKKELKIEPDYDRYPVLGYPTLVSR